MTLVDSCGPLWRPYCLVRCDDDSKNHVLVNSAEHRNSWQSLFLQSTSKQAMWYDDQVRKKVFVPIQQIDIKDRVKL